MISRETLDNIKSKGEEYISYVIGDEPERERKVSSMKGIKLLLIVAMVALLAGTVSLVSHKAYAADHIAYLVPAESGVVETGGGEIPAVLMAPTKFDNERIELLLPAGSEVAETGGGEIPAVLMAPTKFADDRIELVPAAK